MINGESRNWIRFTITLETFYSLYGNWPSKIHLYPFFIAELQEKLSEEDFQIIESKIMLIADEDNPFLALDDAGNKFDYARGNAHETKELSSRAIDWLEINEPDYYD
jgi:hypothetical protein